MDLLDLANAQAGYETLPPPIRALVAENVDMKGNKNATAIVEKLIEAKKIKRTNDGGVEFSMDNDAENEKKERGEDREFTEKEIESAMGLYENLPAPMKAMLAQSVGEKNDGNTTAVVMKMIKEKKLLPSEDGVEFVVFGNEDDGKFMEEIEGAGYVQSMLPEVTRKEGQAPSEEDAMVFFGILGKNTFNARSKPERIPGGFIIRGENKLENGNDLVKALEAKFKESSIADKMNFYYIKDPTAVSQEKFEEGDFENPVIMLTGTDLSPDTNRLAKPVVTALGGISIASFAVAVCLSTDLKMDVDMVEKMTSPLVFSILFTQVAHEAAHQIVALKDKVSWLML